MSGKGGRRQPQLHDSARFTYTYDALKRLTAGQLK